MVKDMESALPLCLQGHFLCEILHEPYALFQLVAPLGLLPPRMRLLGASTCVGHLPQKECPKKGDKKHDHSNGSTPLIRIVSAQKFRGAPRQSPNHSRNHHHSD